MLPIETKNDMFGLYLYPEAKTLMEKQQDIMWFAQEIPVEKDIDDYRTKLSEDELRLVEFTLQLFVETEQTVGNIWSIVHDWFPHSEIEGACSTISMMEKSVHAFFYQKMSDVMNIAPETIRHNQQTIKALREKLNMLNTIVGRLEGNKPLILACVALIEQVTLFSNFAMLKAFQANGNNLIPNTIAGVNYVVNDETLHGIFASYLHNKYIEELKEYSTFNEEKHYKDVLKVIDEIVSHEEAVIDYLFKDDKPIIGITNKQLKLFLRDRVDEVLKLFNMEPIYNIDYNPIGEWFYLESNSIKIHDFFVSITNQYRRNWSEESFSIPLGDDDGNN